MPVTYLFIERGKVVGSFEVSGEYLHPAEVALGYRDGRFPNATVAMLIGGEDDRINTKANCLADMTDLSPFGYPIQSHD